MTPTDVPVVGPVVESGADDRAFDLLLACGPLLVALVAVGGRTVWTEAAALGYVTLFVATVLYRGVRTRGRDP